MKKITKTVYDPDGNQIEYFEKEEGETPKNHRVLPFLLIIIFLQFFFALTPEKEVCNGISQPGSVSRLD